MGIVESMKASMLRQAGKFVGSLVKNSSTENIARLFGTVAALSKEPTKSGLKKLTQMAKDDHPMIKSWQRVFQSASPKAVEKAMTNLVVNEFALGEKIRQEKMLEHEVVIPKLLVLSPTYACNLNCVGCYAGLYGRKYQLSKEEVSSIIRQANELGIYFFIITGGEPFVWPHLLEIFEEFNDSYFQVYTNGTLITKEVAKKLAELGNATFAVSVEGFEGETDWRRGRGVFEKIKTAWANLKEAGVIYGTSVTATRLNHDVMMKDEFWQFLKDNGVAYAWVFQFMPVGMNPSMDLVPTPEQRYERFFKTEEQRLGGGFAFVADFWNHGFLTNGCLAAGAKYLHINAKGYVEPCVFQQFAVDSIREKSLIEILKSPFFTAYKRMVPYSNNLFRPCPIIDNPKVLRAMVNKFNAIPQHDGSENVVTELAGQLDELAESWKQYADKLYYEEGFAETHPAHRGVYDFEVRMRKYANNEEKLAIDKKP
ncbi:MAG: radical SAM protein [Mesotoga sp.]|mgnify:FL=1|jgi:MoaA/NifB/PqqE/SkfB family radical SAM enzyme|uniref:Putative Fe-S oxidoreductase n=1 Tax=Mesotoga infera TaxID=1236046 RepID=A0A7Z7LH50_9BACT|nr:radical SAM protein [Mesotoga infera]MBP8661468.1 radical SAM protein [Mesotoga sp.]NLI06931.1 radical SAM protein [Thermotogaceae bacterium]SSC13877.1 putative Fe-S oxidoreductase [Mesotoga infera]HNS66463.1 radical SAM protein [Mesotoga infera]HON28967.1 radical SAM protein [Mesotoga infera]